MNKHFCDLIDLKVQKQQIRVGSEMKQMAAIL